MKIKKQILLLLIILPSMLFSTSSFPKKYNNLNEMRADIGEEIYNALEISQTRLDDFYKQEDEDLLELLNTSYNDFDGGIEELHAEIKSLIARGADPQRINEGLTIGNPVFVNDDIQAETIQLLIDDKERPLNPNHLLRLLLQSIGSGCLERAIEVSEFTDQNVEQLEMECRRSRLNDEKLQELIEVALKNGADPNSFFVYNCLEGVSEQIFKLLFENDYIKIKPDLFEKYLEMYECGNMLVNYELDEFYFDLDSYYESRYGNLNTSAFSDSGIPKTIHQIWFTNELERREMPPSRVLHVLNMQYGLSQIENEPWKHIVWTNDISLIPVTKKILEGNNIQVKEITEINKHFKNKETIDNLIKDGRFGTVSDIARFEIINECGGVYTDLDFVFVENIDDKMDRSDFWGITDTHGSEIDPYFFAASSKHPILVDYVNLMAKHITKLFHLAADIGEKGLERTTIYNQPIRPVLQHIAYNTVNMFEIVYHRNANKKGTVDILYSNSDEPIEFPDNWLIEYLQEREQMRQFIEEYLRIQGFLHLDVDLENIFPVCLDLDVNSGTEEEIHIGHEAISNAETTWRYGFDRLF